MNFLTNKEYKISKKFKKKGYFIGNCNKVSFVYIDNFLKKTLLKILKKKIIDLNKLHNFISNRDLNEFRLNVIHNLNKNPTFKYHYFNLARQQIYDLAGNELMMQKNINLSIQFPNDSSSLLPIHSDVWSGDSPYEINLWVPFVDCYNTKSMYILSPKNNTQFKKKIKKKNIISSDQIFNIVKKKLEWIKIKQKNFLLFDQSLPHGNVVNKENETRVSMNCRFKSVFSPYGDKKIGEFFFPITIRSMTEIADEFENPFK